MGKLAKLAVYQILIFPTVHYLQSKIKKSSTVEGGMVFTMKDEEAMHCAHTVAKNSKQTIYPIKLDALCL